MLRYERLCIVSTRLMTSTPASSSNMRVTVCRENPVSSATSATVSADFFGWDAGGYEKGFDEEYFCAT